MTIATLVQAAREARGRAYCPYSRYAVGAALLTATGEVVTGCNVENASYGLTTCAERNAVAAAVVRGFTAFSAIAIATEDGATPCGACRQVLREFGLGLTLHLVAASGATRTFELADLLPESFGPDSIPG